MRKPPPSGRARRLQQSLHMLTSTNRLEFNHIGIQVRGSSRIAALCIETTWPAKSQEIKNATFINWPWHSFFFLPRIYPYKLS